MSNCANSLFGIISEAVLVRFGRSFSQWETVCLAILVNSFLPDVDMLKGEVRKQYLPSNRNKEQELLD